MTGIVLEDNKIKIFSKEAGRMGALKRNILYGNPATLEGRRKGGLISFLKFKSNPKLAIKKGFKLEKEINYPHKSSLLSEFVGIVLGDGSISNYQVRIYFNARTDSAYATFVKEMSLKLFNIQSRLALRPKNTLELTISSRGLVKLLLSLGMSKGNKIKQKVNIPKWIMNDKEYSIACLRGLMDTDGGVYFHNHETKGIKYKNIVLCFTNHSKPLLYSVERILLGLGIETKSDLQERVFVYNRTEIVRYMELVGSHNYNLNKRFASYKGTKAL